MLSFKKYCENKKNNSNKKIRINKIGIIIALAILVFFSIGFLFTPNNPLTTNITNKYLSPCKEYPLGTDGLGRCILSRILESGKNTLGIVLLGSVIVLFIGVTIGLLMARKNGKQNPLLNSILNAITAIPPLAYLIIMISAFGNSVATMLIALTVSLTLRMIKLVITLTELEFQKAYIKCSIASGASKMRILFVHILPNIIKDIIEFICLSCSDMILSISGFSFIGLSLGDEIVDWGTMISDASKTILNHPNLLLLPTLCVVICSICFNFIGNNLKRRDA